MKRLIAIIVLLSYWALMGGAAGQSAKPEAPPPKNPLLPRAPEFSSWTIAEKMGPSKAAPGAEATANGDPSKKEVRYAITKTGTTYREVYAIPGIGETTKWVIDGFQIKQDPGARRLIRIPRKMYSSEFSDYVRSDFEPFEWISRETYKGVEKYDGRLCYVFEVDSGKKRLTPRERYDRSAVMRESDEPSGKASGEQAATEASHTLTAYLDVTTQLPVALRKGEIWTIYTFNPPPAGPLSPPADVQENLAKWQSAIQARNRPPPRP